MLRKSELTRQSRLLDIVGNPPGYQIGIQQSFDSGKNLKSGKWLFHEIICPDPAAKKQFCGLLISTDHYDWNMCRFRILAQGSQGSKTIDPRQDNIEKYQIRQLGLGKINCALCIQRFIRDKTSRTENFFQGKYNCWRVINNQSLGFFLCVYSLSTSPLTPRRNTGAIITLRIPIK